MSLTQKIKQLADEKNMTFAEIERNTGISNGQIRRWDSSSPKIENIQKVADYFNVSVDYLLGRTDSPTMPSEQEDDELMAFFRINTDNMTDFQKEEFEKEMKKFAEYVKFKFDSDKKE